MSSSGCIFVWSDGSAYSGDLNNDCGSNQCVVVSKNDFELKESQCTEKHYYMCENIGNMFLINDYKIMFKYLTPFFTIKEHLHDTCIAG